MEISSDNKEKEAFWETSWCSVKSSHRVTAFPSRSLPLRQFLWNWQSDIWKPTRAMVKKEISSDEIWKEAVRETAQCSVNSSHRVTAVFPWSLCYPYFCEIWQQIFPFPLKTIGTKEISSDNKEKEDFWETSLCYVKSSHKVTAFPSRSHSLRQFLWNWQSDIWRPIEGYGEKGNILRWNLERSFLRNCLVFC